MTKVKYRLPYITPPCRPFLSGEPLGPVKRLSKPRCRKIVIRTRDLESVEVPGLYLVRCELPTTELTAVGPLLTFHFTILSKGSQYGKKIHWVINCSYAPSIWRVREIAKAARLDRTGARYTHSFTSKGEFRPEVLVGRKLVIEVVEEKFGDKTYYRAKSALKYKKEEVL